MSRGSHSDPAFRQTFAAGVEQLKRIDRFDGLCARLIPCKGRNGYLMPVCDLHRDDPRLVAELARWREENYFAFPSQFPVTIEGTTRWLQKGILENPDRLLLLVLDRCGHAMGHVGLTEYGNDRSEVEIENIVRGVKDAAPGLMSRAMLAMLGWARDAGARHFHLRVFNDNPHAVNFYRRLGFRDDELLGLRKHVEGPSVIYRPLAEGDHEPPDKQFLRMVCP
jgi:perosamine synthetase